MSTLNSLETLRSKIRALTEDLEKTDFEVFTYENSAVFTLAESNINEISSVKINETILSSGDYSLDTDTNELTIILPSGMSWSVNDTTTVKYKFNKYSNTELNKYIEASLTWLSIYSTGHDDYELEDDGIHPIPDNPTMDLIAIISSIIINPNYSSYRLPNLSVRYPKTMSKEDRIEKLVRDFQLGLGINDIITYDYRRSTYED